MTEKEMKKLAMQRAFDAACERFNLSPLDILFNSDRKIDYWIMGAASVEEENLKKEIINKGGIIDGEQL